MNSNYRVIQHNDAAKRERWFAIHAVFYDEIGEVIGYSQNPECCSSNRIEDLRIQVDVIKRALDEDVLVASHIEASIGKKRMRSERDRRTQRSFTRR